METTTWELSKENIQPLKKGRKMENLEPALQQQSDSSIKIWQEKMRGAYKIAIDSYEGDDPLEPWCSYIEWIEQNFPKGGKESELMVQLQQCVATFRSQERYHNDSRFVSLILSLADMIPDPVEVYRFMSGKGIGSRVAEFYISWAIELELQGKMKGADEVYLNGLAQNAEPRDDLIQRHTQFSARMIHISVDKSNCTEAAISEEHRAILGPLKPRGRRHLVGTNRIGAAKLTDQVIPIQGESSSSHQAVSHRPRRQMPIQVFTDENDSEPSAVPPRTTHQTVLPTSSDTVKENERRVTKWKEAAIVVKAPATAPVKFEVHVDENIDPPKHGFVHKPLESTTALSTKKVRAHDVMKAICGLGEPDQKGEILRERYQCCVTKIHSKEREEMQFEELRALRWRRKAKANIKLTDQETCVLKIKENLLEATKALSVFNFKLESSLPTSGEILHPKKSGVTQLDRLLAELLPLSATLRHSNEQLASRFTGPSDDRPSPGSGSYPQHHQHSRSSTGSAKPSSQNSTVTTTPGNNTTKLIRGLFADSVVQSLHPDHPDAGQVTSMPPPPPPATTDRQKFTVFEDMTNKPKFTVFEDTTTNKQPKVAFTVFQDASVCEGGAAVPVVVPVQTQLPYVPPPPGMCDEPEQENIENLQNIPPKDYEQPLCKRVLAGILEPSVGIEIEPIEVEPFEAEAMDEDMLDATSPAPDFMLREDITMAFPSSTCFFKNLRVASTPSKSSTTTPLHYCSTTAATTNHQAAHGVQETNQQQHGQDSMPDSMAMATTKDGQWQEPGSKDSVGGQDHFTPRRYTRPTSFGYPTKQYNLSAISECSREYRSSSSSGTSSSAAVSQGKSQLCASSRNKTHEELNKSDKSRVVTTTTTIPKLNFPYKSVNPFDDNLIASLLDSLKVPLCSYPGYVGIKDDMPRVKVNANMFLGDEMYHVSELCAEGGCAKVFKAMSLNDSDLDGMSSAMEMVVLKVQTPACPLEFYISKELQSRMKKLNLKYSAIPSIMDVTSMYVYNNASIQVTSYLPHGTLLTVCNLYTGCNQLMPECLVLHFTIEMLHIIEQVHACRVIHADIKPDNFMIMKSPSTTVERNSFGEIIGTTKTLKLIDYGLSIDLDLMPPGTTFLASTKTDQFQCHEMKDNRPWTYQTDFYGIAACAYVMLFGSYMKTSKIGDTWKINGACKRYWLYDWKQFFHDLLNIPDCSSQPNTRAIRESLEACFEQKRIQKDIPSKVNELQAMMQFKKQFH